MTFTTLFYQAISKHFSSTDGGLGLEDITRLSPKNVENITLPDYITVSTLICIRFWRITDSNDQSGKPLKSWPSSNGPQVNHMGCWLTCGNHFKNLVLCFPSTAKGDERYDFSARLGNPTKVASNMLQKPLQLLWNPLKDCSYLKGFLLWNLYHISIYQLEEVHQFFYFFLASHVSHTFLGFLLQSP